MMAQHVSRDNLKRSLLMTDRFFPIALLAMTMLASPAVADEAAREVAVSGKGEISVVPDQATLTLGVEMRAREMEPAKQQVSQIVSEFLKLAARLDIDKQHLNTSQLTIRPEYDWNTTNRQRRLTGFYVARQIRVELKDLEKIGPLMERATSLGVNQVNGPYFSSSREAELRREALRLAAEDARRNAQVVATALGASLGPVRSIRADDASLPPPPGPQARMMMAEAASAEQSYEVGEMDFSARVNAIFDLIIKP